MKGKLIVIEGTDGSGKQTQTELLYNNLKNLGHNVKLISFPNYKSNASWPVKMFLSGEFGSIENISVYASSSFYAIDRYASFKKEWESFYNSGGIVISDRYTISNIIHQANRIKEEKEFYKYIDWIKDLEWNKFSIPKPDITILLDMPYEFSNSLMKNRANKITGELKKDILESDENQKLKAYNTAIKISNILNCKLINCVENNSIRSIEDIQKEIIDYVKENII